MLTIKLYQNNGNRGNRKVLEKIARDIFETDCKEDPELLEVTANFAKRSAEDGRDVFDLSLETRGRCSTYVIEIEKSGSGLYKEKYTKVGR